MTINAQQSGGLKRLLYTLEASRLRLWETSIARQTDGVIVKTIEDQVALVAAGVPSCNLFVITLPNDTAREIPYRPERGVIDIYYIGAMRRPENRAAIQTYLRCVLPTLDSSFRFNVFGEGLPSSLTRTLTSRGALVHGYVENLDAALVPMRLACFPIVMGGGIKLKVLEAIQRGIPVVTTPLGAVGMPVGKPHLHVAPVADFARMLSHVSSHVPERISTNWDGYTSAAIQNMLSCFG